MHINQTQTYALVNALDKFLASAITSIVEENVDKKIHQNMGIRLQARYGVDITKSIENFHMFDATLREFFGAKADTLEKDFVTRLISLDTTKKASTSIVIQDQELARLILESYGNREKRRIMDITLKAPAPILEILENCKIPKSSGYRIISELVENGLLIEEGYVSSEGKRAITYGTLFENVSIDIEKDGIVVKVAVRENTFHESFLVKILLGL